MTLLWYNINYITLIVINIRILYFKLFQNTVFRVSYYRNKPNKPPNLKIYGAKVKENTAEMKQKCTNTEEIYVTKINY